MFLLRVIVIAGAGLIAWLVRLVFLASVAAGVYGVYLAWFASLGQSGPGRDRLAGTIVMGVALGVGLIFATVLCMPPFRRDGSRVCYTTVFVLFATVFITTIWPLSAALCSIGTWERSDVQIAATAVSCSTQVDGNDDASYSCLLDWTVDGHAHVQVRTTDGAYPDGTRVELWVDPVTGGADDHDWVPVFWGFFGMVFGLIPDAFALYLCAAAVPVDCLPGPGEWAQDMAWWRSLPKRKNPAPAPAPPQAPEIADAIPPSRRQGGVEDAHP